MQPTRRLPPLQQNTHPTRVVLLLPMLCNPKTQAEPQILPLLHPYLPLPLDLSHTLMSQTFPKLKAAFRLLLHLALVALRRANLQKTNLPKEVPLQVLVQLQLLTTESTLRLCHPSLPRPLTQASNLMNRASTMAGPSWKST